MLPALARPHRQPDYEIRVDGENITASLKGRLVSLTLTDNRGAEADMLDITLDDADGRLGMPPRGAELRVAIGWSDTGLVDKGSYTVDEVAHRGAPDQLIIRARSADLRGGLTTKQERSWHGTTVGAMVRTIADENGLVPMVAKSLADQVLGHIDQANESAIALLTRIGDLFDAIATVKDGRLIFMPVAGAMTASGKPLGRVTIERKHGDQHDFSIADRHSYTAVKATYYDTATGEKGEVIWGKEEDDAERGRRVQATTVPATPAGTATAYQVLAIKAASRAKAQRRAKAEWKRLSKNREFQARWAGVAVPYQDRVLLVSGEARYGREEEAKARQRARRQADRDAAKAAPPVAIEHSADNLKTLRHVYANKENAKRAARAEWRRLQRGMATFSITLAEGRPELMPELPATVTGFKADIDNTEWILVKATHNLSDSGFTTAVELEIRATEISV